jgi:hypothetical protein
MNSEEQTETVSRRDYLQRLTHTWFIRLLAVISIVGLCIWAAAAIWKGRDLIAIVIIVFLVVYGLRKAIDLFPIPAKIRLILAKRDRLSALYASHRYKSWLWLGVIGLLHALWRYYDGLPVRELTLGIAVFFFCVGLVATIIWHFKHGNTKRVT